MRFTYCVWYRVTDDGPDTERIVRGLMARLACRTGVAGRLMRKRDEPRLWMELYAGVVAPAAFESALRELADTYDVDMFLSGERRIECFIEDEAGTEAHCGTGGGA